MLQFNPFHRPSVQDLMEKPFFDEVRHIEEIELGPQEEIRLHMDTTSEYVGLA